MLTKLIAKFQAYQTAEDGATAIEYGLIAAGIAVVIAAAVFAFGEELNTMFLGLGGTLRGDAAP